MASTPEGKIQLKILRYLREQGHLFWRFSPETYNAQLGRHIKHHYIPNGLSDIMVLHKRGLIMLEVKTPKGRPSAGQIVMQKRVERLGHEYHFVRSVEEVEDLGL